MLNEMYKFRCVVRLCFEFFNCHGSSFQNHVICSLVRYLVSSDMVGTEYCSLELHKGILCISTKDTLHGCYGIKLL